MCPPNKIEHRTLFTTENIADVIVEAFYEKRKREREDIPPDLSVRFDATSGWNDVVAYVVWYEDAPVPNTFCARIISWFEQKWNGVIG